MLNNNKSPPLHLADLLEIAVSSNTPITSIWPVNSPRADDFSTASAILA